MLSRAGTGRCRRGASSTGGEADEEADEKDRGWSSNWLCEYGLWSLLCRDGRALPPTGFDLYLDTREDEPIGPEVADAAGRARPGMLGGRMAVVIVNVAGVAVVVSPVIM